MRQMALSLTWRDPAVLLELGFPEDGSEIVPYRPEVRLSRMLREVEVSLSLLS